MHRNPRILFTWLFAGILFSGTIAGAPVSNMTSAYNEIRWESGLAMRRLGKDCIFLQYRGEPHHLKQCGKRRASGRMDPGRDPLQGGITCSMKANH